MQTNALPPRERMLEAFLARDSAFEGIFVSAVRTTGIFCRPSCPAHKPRAENVEFYPSPREALLAGYRPCRRCSPLAPAGAAPPWLEPLLERVAADPPQRWTDAGLRAAGFDPVRVRRWFKARHGMTFHAWQRARRLGAALGQIQGGESVTGASLDCGYDSESAFRVAFKRLVGSSPRDARGAPVVKLTRIATPLGPLLAAATEDALRLLEFVDRRQLETQLRRLQKRLPGAFVPGENDLLAETTSQLTAYFAGQRREFDVPLRALGTPFQEQVWEALQAIPCGETRSYGQLARSLGRPTASRAVARANGDNPIAILVPCHRVVGSDGRLTGYGGGLWRKRYLLRLEAVEEPGEVGQGRR